MLSGEGNDGERWKTAIGLISKKTTLHLQNTFFVISLPLFCTTTTRNFQTIFFYGGNVIHVLVHFFFAAAHFLLALVAASFSHFVTAATKFSPPALFFQQTMTPLFFISCSRSLSPFFSLSLLACRLLSLFLCLSLALYSKFVDMTINLSWIL